VSEEARKRRLVCTIVLLFVPLVIFKYADFLYNEVLGAFLPFTSKIIDEPLPLGISFVTFTLIAYVVDTVTGRFRLDHSKRDVYAYTLFFPHLIAGPILRPREFIPQLPVIASRKIHRPALALTIIMFGVLKKVVFADQIGAVVDTAYGAPSALDGWTALLAIYGFSAQIYCDFSGYTDIAIGLAMLMGIRLPINFRKPYSAASLIEFWHRWHISLSRWLRDYLYVPLGGNKMGRVRQISNIVVTMTLGGLWHGANWTFIVWGLLHGVGLALVHVLRPLRLPVPKMLAIFTTFHFVVLAWVLFRAPNMEVAYRILAAPFTASWDESSFSRGGLAFILTSVFFLLHRWDSHGTMRWLVNRIPLVVLYSLNVGILVLAVVLSQGSSAKFIYFDF
jgi:D-alanyl-lipoteichoic acid acyltransferase DltB (MBOAT superfamily)